MPEQAVSLHTLEQTIIRETDSIPLQPTSEIALNIPSKSAPYVTKGNLQSLKRALLVIPTLLMLFAATGAIVSSFSSTDRSPSITSETTEALAAVPPSPEKSTSGANQTISRSPFELAREYKRVQFVAFEISTRVYNEDQVGAICYTKAVLMN